MVEGHKEKGVFHPHNSSSSKLSFSDVVKSEQCSDVDKIDVEKLKHGKIKNKQKKTTLELPKPNEIDVHNIDDKITIVEGLNVKDSDDIINAVIDVWKKTPKEVKNYVTEIRIIEDNKNRAFGMFQPSTGIIFIYVDPTQTKDDYEDTLSHELGHAWFDKELRKSSKKLYDYGDEIEKLPPVTYYAKMYYDDYVKQAGKLDELEEHSKSERKIYKQKKEFASALILYVDENHADTAMFINSNDKSRHNLGVISEPVMDESVKLYKKLHAGRK